ncbi:MAG: DUF4160 domain-containing protein [Symploca sp. SIO2C1]|nr:DUF4160 domain-containing protein [Symploca sp. SIO2C1]
MNPKLLEVKGYKFSFYSDEHEPPHVHVKKSGCEAVFEIEPIKLRRNFGFSDKQLRDIEKMIKVYQSDFLGKWHEYFST